MRELAGEHRQGEHAVDDLGDVAAGAAAEQGRQARACHDAVGVGARELGEHILHVRIDVLGQALNVVLDGDLLLDVVGVELRELAPRPALGERPERRRAARLLRGLDALVRLGAGGGRVDPQDDLRERLFVAGAAAPSSTIFSMNSSCPAARRRLTQPCTRRPRACTSSRLVAHGASSPVR